MATQFENGLTLSQLAERNAELVTEVEKLRAERDASLNEERVWEKTMMEVCGEDGPASVAVEIRNLLALRNTALTALKAQVEQLAAENVAIPAELDASRTIPREQLPAVLATISLMAERKPLITPATNFA